MIMQNLCIKFFKFLIVFIVINAISIVNYFHNTSSYTFAYESQNKYKKDLLLLYQTAMRHNRNLELGKSQQQLALEIIENYLQSQLIVYRIQEKRQLIAYYENIINYGNLQDNELINSLKSKKAVLLMYIKRQNESFHKHIKNIRYLAMDDFNETDLHKLNLNLLIDDTENNNLYITNAHTAYVNNMLNNEKQKIRKHFQEYKDYLQKLQIQSKDSQLNKDSKNNKDNIKAKSNNVDVVATTTTTTTTTNAKVSAEIKANLQTHIKEKANKNIAKTDNKNKQEIDKTTIELNKLRLTLIESYTDYFITRSRLLFKDYRLTYHRIHDINHYLNE